MERHAHDFAELHAAAGLEGKRVDLCGFSFGGRVCSTIAATYPELVRRVVLTGVPAERDPHAKLLLQSWLAALRGRDGLESMIWQSVLNTHSRPFLDKYHDNVSDWVKAGVAANSRHRLLSLMEQAYHDDDDPSHDWHTVSVASRMKAPTLLISGAKDLLAPLDMVHRLASMGGGDGGGGGWSVDILEDSGHMVYTEQPVKWRKSVLAFLDADEV